MTLYFLRPLSGERLPGVGGRMVWSDAAEIAGNCGIGRTPKKRKPRDCGALQTVVLTSLICSPSWWLSSVSLFL